MLLLSVSHRFSKCADAIGLGNVRFHDLRHAYPTRLLERGVHPKVVSEALGHSSITITMDTYSHVMPSMSQVVADAIDVVLGE
jgi:integrase